MKKAMGPDAKPVKPKVKVRRKRVKKVTSEARKKAKGKVYVKAEDAVPTQPFVIPGVEVRRKPRQLSLALLSVHHVAGLCCSTSLSLSSPLSLTSLLTSFSLSSPVSLSTTLSLSQTAHACTPLTYPLSPTTGGATQ